MHVLCTVIAKHWNRAKFNENSWETKKKIGGKKLSDEKCDKKQKHIKMKTLTKGSIQIANRIQKQKRVRVSFVKALFV